MSNAESGAGGGPTGGGSSNGSGQEQPEDAAAAAVVVVAAAAVEAPQPPLVFHASPLSLDLLRQFNEEYPAADTTVDNLMSTLTMEEAVAHKQQIDQLEAMFGHILDKVGNIRNSIFYFCTPLVV